MDCESDITAGLKWKPPHNASSSLSGAVTDCQQTCFANTLIMLKMSLTVISGGVANSLSSISISLTGMAGTFLLYAFFDFLVFFFFFNKHIFSSNTNPHRAAEKKENLTTGQKKGSREMHFPALSRKNIYSGTGWGTIRKCLKMSEYTQSIQHYELMSNVNAHMFLTPQFILKLSGKTGCLRIKHTLMQLITALKYIRLEFSVSVQAACSANLTVYLKLGWKLSATGKGCE